MGRTLRSQNLKFALKASSGLNVGMVYPLTTKRNVLGRAVDAAVPIEDSKASRNHASIDIQNGYHYLVDLGSTNGTYLNGMRLENAKRVSLGDQVRIGTSTFVVELLDQAKANLSSQWRESTRAVLMPPRLKEAGLQARHEVLSPLMAESLPPSQVKRVATQQLAAKEIASSGKAWAKKLPQFVQKIFKVGQAPKSRWRYLLSEISEERRHQSKTAMLSLLAISLVLAAILM